MKRKHRTQQRRTGNYVPLEKRSKPASKSPARASKSGKWLSHQPSSYGRFHKGRAPQGVSRREKA